MGDRESEEVLIIERIKLAREKTSQFEKMYGMDYAAFSERVQVNEQYYEVVANDNPLWEQDALEWKYWEMVVGFHSQRSTTTGMDGKD